MVKSEKGSVTLIVLATILFILAVLATNLIYISSKRKSQIQETMILQNVYDTGMNETYNEQIEKRNATTQVFSYTGKVQTYTVTKSGTYILEVYGAEGGSASLTKKTGETETSSGVKGDYTKGTIELKKGQTLYVYIGKKGEDSSKTEEDGNNTTEETNITVSASGGKATYISTKEGELSLQSNSENDILVIAKGGNGGHCGTGSTGGTGEGSDKTGSAENVTTQTGNRSGNGYAKISLSKEIDE